MVQFKEWMKKGEPWVWMNAAAVSISLIMVVGLLGLIAVRGLSHFWPHAVLEASYVHDDGTTQVVLGEVADDAWVRNARLDDMGMEASAEGGLNRVLIKRGNRDLTGQDFSWFWEARLQDVKWPEDIVVIERREWGNFYGRLLALKENGNTVATGEEALGELRERLQRANELLLQVREIEKGEMGALNYRLEQLRLQQRRLELQGGLTPVAQADIEAERSEIHKQFEVMLQQLQALNAEASRDVALVTTVEGKEKELPLSLIVKVTQPNALGVGEKLVEYCHRFMDFLTEDPRESNTEGGIFPAIFGTVLMVLIMSIIVTPFGVITAVYLREYAKQGWMTRTIRIAVNNLAGVPSIVYGVFGLGFFVYFLGAGLDDIFYPEAAPAPVFGTPGLMWASITLAILTVPVVIVATEEGLARIPRSVREGSLALGATKFETLWRVVLPMSSPAMMTGLILAIARAAGEVAPLMLVGVVKLAPTLPIDGNAPFLHLERKFMHLGFHIYDVGFQSPNVEAAQPLVYATAFLLVLVIALLNLSAVLIRNRLRERYRALET